MARGPKKHLKRLNAPKHWMLSKLDGIFAPRPSTGPHKLRESLPLILILRNRLKYALTKAEANAIVKQKFVKVDGKTRTDVSFPAGFMDIVTIEKSGDYFRLLFDVKGRFTLHRLEKGSPELGYKLCRVNKHATTANKVPFIVTHDGRTIRYPDPLIKVNDTVKVDIETGKVLDHIKFDLGNLVMITRGHNNGRVGVIQHIERHPGSFDIITVKDANGSTFATRRQNVFVIGKGNKPEVSLPKGKGIKITVVEERAQRKIK